MARTVDYYLARTSHRSTLSSVATAWVLAWYAPLRFDPAMAPQIKHLRFSVHYHGYRVELGFSEDSVEVTSRPGPAAPITVLAREQTIEPRPGGRNTLSLEQGRQAHERVDAG